MLPSYLQHLLCIICYNRYARRYSEVTEPWSSACPAQIQSVCNMTQDEGYKFSMAAANASAKIHAIFWGSSSAVQNIKLKNSYSVRQHKLHFVTLVCHSRNEKELSRSFGWDEKCYKPNAWANGQRNKLRLLLTLGGATEDGVCLHAHWKFSGKFKIKIMLRIDFCPYIYNSESPLCVNKP